MLAIFVLSDLIGPAAWLFTTIHIQAPLVGVVSDVNSVC